VRGKDAEELDVRASGEDADDLLNRLARGDADAIDARRLDADQLELSVDLRATTVDEDDARAALRALSGVQRDDPGEGVAVLVGRLEECAADLDDEGATRAGGVEFDGLCWKRNLAHGNVEAPDRGCVGLGAVVVAIGFSARWLSS
jgi:hypothetical protein